MGYIASSGRVCHCSTSASTSSVIVEIRSGQPSHPYSFNPCPRISRTLIPRAYRRITCASKPGKRRCDISQYAQAQKWKAGRMESPGAHHPQAGAPFGATAVAVMAHLSLRILLRRRPRGLLSTFDSILSAHLYFYIFYWTLFWLLTPVLI